MNATVAPGAIASATDAELVDAVRLGGEEAFEELFRRYRPPVHAFVQRRVRDNARAEDLTQESFLSALRRLRETDSQVAFRPWIYEIARNATIDHFRRATRAEEVSVENVDGLRAGDHLRLMSDQAPDRHLAAKQELETLRGALDELSERHERILVLRELEGLSYHEIGDRMELTRPGVESTLFRARRRLKSEFSELETGRRCAIVRGAMGRLAEGLDLRGDRGKMMRHVRRCPACRATARELGLLSERRSHAARAAAMLPLPAFLARRMGEPSGMAAELAGALGAKGAALVAALVLAGGSAGLGALSDDQAPRGAHERPAPAVPPADDRAKLVPQPATARHQRGTAVAGDARIQATLAQPTGPSAPVESAPVPARAPLAASAPQLPVDAVGLGRVVPTPVVPDRPLPTEGLVDEGTDGLVERGTAGLPSVLPAPQPPAASELPGPRPALTS